MAKLLAQLLLTAALIGLSHPASALDVIAVLDDNAAEIGAALGPADGVMIDDSGQVIGVGDDFGNNTTLLWTLDRDNTQLTIPIQSIGGNPLFLSATPSSGFAGDAPQITFGGISPGGSLNVSSQGLTSTDPEYLDVIRDAWQDIADRLEALPIPCVIVSMKVQPISVLAEYMRDGELTGDILSADHPINLNRFDRVNRTYTVWVHCQNRETYTFLLTITDPNPRSTDEVRTTSIGPASIAETIPNRATAKGGNLPPAVALPPGELTLTRGLQAVGGYLGLADNGQDALPTVLWFGPQLEPLEVLQLDGPPASFGSDLQLCGDQAYEHLWMTWTSDNGRAQLARIANRNATVEDLGAAGGMTSLTCDAWGNAVVAFSDLPGAQMTVVGFDAEGTETDRSNFASTDGFTGMSIALDMNNNGEIVVAWRTLLGTTRVARLAITEVVDVDMSFAGSWNSVYFDGEGFIWDIAEIDGVLTLVLYYFTYQPDGSGRQAWVVGSAPLINGVATVPVAITQGARFGNAFDSDDVEVTVWGEIEARVTGCLSALMTFRSPLFGDHQYPAQKFTNTPFDLPGYCADDTVATGKGTVTVDGSFTGSFFSPQRNFEGFIFDVTESSGVATLVVYWFSYDSDGSGRQLWLVGAAPITSGPVTVNLVRTSGGQFGPDFDPTAIVAANFVSATIDWSDCDNAVVSFETQDGETGQFAIQRLAPLPGNAGGNCGN